MQPGFSNLSLTPGYKGNEPAHGEPLPGDTAPLAGRRPLIKRLLARFGRSHAEPKV